MRKKYLIISNYIIIMTNIKSQKSCNYEMKSNNYAKVDHFDLVCHNDFIS